MDESVETTDGKSVIVGMLRGITKVGTGHSKPNSLFQNKTKDFRDQIFEENTKANVLLDRDAVILNVTPSF